MKFGLEVGENGNGDDVEAVYRVLEMMPGDVAVRRTDDSLSFSEADGVLGRIGVLAGFDFEENENITLPSDNVYFPAPGSIAGCDDAITTGAEMIDRQNLRAFAEGYQPMKQKRERHK